MASFASTVASDVPSSFMPTFFSQQSSSSFSRATTESRGTTTNDPSRTRAEGGGEVGGCALVDNCCEMA